MSAEIERSVTRRVKAPAEVFDELVKPAGVSLKNWVDKEEARLKAENPLIKDDSIEVSPWLKDAMEVIDQECRLWEEKRKLLRIQLRAEMGASKRATVNGVEIAERRTWNVPDKEVSGYEVDTIVAL